MFIQRLISRRAESQNGKFRGQKQTPKEFEDVEYDRLASKYARDLMRINNGHREYGNVKKKNMIRSQKAELDLSGLLKNHKSVSEFTSGMEASQTFKQSNFVKRTFGSSDMGAENGAKQPKAKIIKKDMSIFD